MPSIKRSHSKIRESAFREPKRAAPLDQDPEDPPSDLSASDGGTSGSEDDLGDDPDAGRAHYESVGKSKLRSRQAAALGPQYSGSKISRGRFGEDEDDEHNAFGEDYDGGTSDSKSEDGQLMSDISGDEEDEAADVRDGTDTSMTYDSDDGNPEDQMTDDGTPEEPSAGSSIDRAALKDLMSESNRSATAALGAASRADAEKGSAIKKQRKTYDGLLNSRIRLQPAVSSINASPIVEGRREEPAAYQGAESAALNLWNTMEALRQSLSGSLSQQKRLTATQSTPLDKIWDHMSAQESHAIAHRRNILNKWSQKTVTLSQASQTQTKSRLIGSSSTQPTIADILQTQHLAPDNVTRLMERSRPQKSGSVAEEAEAGATLYDDAEFYAQLLKDLIESRNTASTATASSTDAALANSTQDALRLAQRAARKRRPDVDTKASKGRKLKYTVHEKLQNFMAPEDRGQWGDRQREELFSSLLGGTRAGSAMVDGNLPIGVIGHAADSYEELASEEEALRLFRQQ